MHRKLSVALVLLLAVVAIAATTTGQSADKFGGTWAGTYDGDASGKLEITITPAAEGKYTGQLVSTSSEGEAYTLPLKSATVEGGKMVSKYDWPQGGEVTMEGTFAEKTAAGKWMVGAEGNAAASGTWKADKK